MVNAKIIWANHMSHVLKIACAEMVFVITENPPVLAPKIANAVILFVTVRLTKVLTRVRKIAHVALAVSIAVIPVYLLVRAVRIRSLV